MGKSSNQLDVTAERYIPETKDDLLRFFGTRGNIQKINNEYFQIYENLAKDNYDYTPVKNMEEEKKMQKLENYFLNKFIADPTKTTQFFDSSPAIITKPEMTKPAMQTYQGGNDTSGFDLANTTSNQIMKDFKEYEDGFGMPDNDMSKVKMSRNAKVLMTKSKEYITSADKSYKMNPEYKLPQGEPIEEDKNQTYIDDSVSVNTGKSRMTMAKRPIVQHINSVFSPDLLKDRSRDDSILIKEKEEKLDLGLSGLIKDSFMLPKMKEEQRADFKKQLSIHDEESKENSSSSSSSDASPAPEKTKPIMIPVRKMLENNLMDPAGLLQTKGIKRRKSKLIGIKETQDKSLTDELIGWNKQRRKANVNLERLNRKSFC